MSSDFNVTRWFWDLELLKAAPKHDTAGPEGAAAVLSCEG